MQITTAVSLNAQTQTTYCILINYASCKLNLFIEIVLHLYWLTVFMPIRHAGNGVSFFLASHFLWQLTTKIAKYQTTDIIWAWSLAMWKYKLGWSLTVVWLLDLNPAALLSPSFARPKCGESGTFFILILDLILIQPTLMCDPLKNKISHSSS